MIALSAGCYLREQAGEINLFFGVNFEPFEMYNFSMWVRESFCSCPKLQEFECWLLRPN